MHACMHAGTRIRHIDVKTELYALKLERFCDPIKWKGLSGRATRGRLSTCGFTQRAIILSESEGRDAEQQC